MNSSILTRVDNVFQKATTDNVSLNPRLVTIANAKLLEEARVNASAWPSVLGVMSDCSGLDIQAAPSFRVNEGCIVSPRTGGLTISIENLTIVGCSGQRIDGLRLKNVEFKDSTIIYHGGPAALQDVQFENCRFLLDYSPASLQLAQALTASKTVTVTLLTN